MKKLSTLFLILANYSFAQTWSTVGDSGLANYCAVEIFSAVAPNGEPYVIYRESSLGSKARVKRFNGSAWISEDSAGTAAGMISTPSMAFDKTGTPYIAYGDDVNNYKATVKKFDGSNWHSVGMVGFTPGGGNYTSIAIDTNGTPYVAFRDTFNGTRASVMKFDGTNWVYVGAPGFSSNTSNGGALYTSLAIDPNGVLYVAYSDINNDFKATVMKFDGSAWVYVGAHGFSAWQANFTSLALDSQGTPYVAYWDRANAGKATVMKFDGNNWIPVGIAGFTPGGVGYTSLAIDKNDDLYLAFKDYSNNQKATVMTFNGSNWVIVGNAGFSNAWAEFTTISIDKNNGILYVAYEDIYNATTLYPTKDATVMKYTIPTGIKDASTPLSITVYPNPTSKIITINITVNNPKGDFILKVNNSIGQTVYSENLKEISTSFTKQINLSFLPKGIYYLELNSSTPGSPQKKVEVKKIVLQ